MQYQTPIQRTLAAIGTIFLLLTTLGSAGLVVPARAGTTVTPTIKVTSSPQIIYPGDVLTLNVTITSPASSALNAVRVTQVLSPALTLQHSGVVGGSQSCPTLPCSLGKINIGTSAQITSTYEIGNLAPTSLISYTITVSATELSAPRIITNTLTVAQPIVYLPLVRKPFPDPYAQWQKLTPPAAGSAINYLFVSRGTTCAGPVIEENLPDSIFAATDSGIFQLVTASTQGISPTWKLRGSSTISATHIITSQGSLFASAFNQSAVLRSDDAGATWHDEALAGNRGVYWLADSGTRILAAGTDGLFIREGGVWRADPKLKGSITGVAVAGSNAYAIQYGTNKDTLWRSTAGGAAGTWISAGQILGTTSFMQTIDTSSAGGPELLVGTVDGGLYSLGAGGLTPFSSGLNLTVYGIWRDGQSRIYAAMREPGGLMRFGAAGGVGESLSSAAGAPPTSERLYTVSGRDNSSCNIIAVGSRAGAVWVRRIP
ncbi:MAG: hypothetical protein WCF99_05215 [Chloroflexales bacterium]